MNLNIDNTLAKISTGARKPKLHWDGELVEKYGIPFYIVLTVAESEMDHQGHVSHINYLRWMEATSWQQNNQIGVTTSKLKADNFAMVAKLHEIEYKASCYAHDVVAVASWVIEANRLFNQRIYRIVRVHDGKELLHAKSKWVCVDLYSGKPKRLPNYLYQCFDLALHTQPEPKGK